ncbi:NAD(P)/FAD-dependent oxidoreductase [Gimesia benthica]|nr:FAD-dependent oxidoreductase [Gimesia benthica]
MMKVATRKQNVAVIGAGIGGLCCARQLSAAGFSVRIFDKSRGVGGRVSVRRHQTDIAFDHGAQYFTVEDTEMAQQVESWLAAGVVAPWQCRMGSLDTGVWKPTNSETRHFVGVPDMTAIAKHLARDLELILQTRVTSVARHEHGWQLLGDEEWDLGIYDVLILNAPAPQSASLLKNFPEFAQQIDAAKFAPCWSVMLAFDQPLDVPWDAATVHDSPLSWIARNSSKPGRPTRPDCWLLQGNPDWSNTHLEDVKEIVMAQLISCFWEAIGLVPRPHRLADVHRWRFALPSELLEQQYLFNEDLGVGACGDWCVGPRIESAYLSGLALAEEVRKRY